MSEAILQERFDGDLEHLKMCHTPFNDTKHNKIMILIGYIILLQQEHYMQ